VRCPRCFRKLAPGAACPADGARAATEAEAGVDPTGDQAAAPAEPPSLAGWRVLGPLAAGGQAAVWRAARADDERPCALKVGLRASPELAARFADEAAALAVIGPPAVAALVEHGALVDGRPYLAMELLAGDTLGAILAGAPAPPAIEEAVGWGRALAGALAAIHAAGFVHRDLKPENIVRDPDGRLRVLDLGLAQRWSAEAGDAAAPGEAATRPRTVAAGPIVGSPLYMAPEQLRGEDVDPRADLYGLGAILFEAITLRPPFVGDRAAIELGHLALRAPRVASLRPVPARLDALVAACLAKAPADRPTDARALAAALADAAASPTVTAAPTAAAAARTPIALCAALGLPASVDVEALARRRGGQVARQHPGRALLAFVTDDCPAPLPAALATARAVADAGARAIVHVAAVTARRARTGRTMLFGPALDRADEWAPRADVAIALTAAAARELDVAEVTPLAGPDGLHVLRDDVAATAITVDDPDAPPLVGRAPQLARALASASAALAGGPPALWIALGGPGSGKSRLAAELAARVAAEHPAATVVRVDGRRAFGADAHATLRLIADRLGLAATAATDATASPVERVRALVDAALDRGPLALVIDDAHWLDDAVLAALAVAVRALARPLWIAALASDTLRAVRPAWLDGARASVHDLPPLDRAATRDLLRAMLVPARRVPDALVARLAARCGGVPGVVAALARELRRAGVVRRHPGSDVWYLAADELDFLPPTPGVAWFVERELAALGPGLPELARACALLGPSFSAGEADAAARVPAAGVAIDTAIGLGRLVTAGLLTGDDDGHRFRTEAEQDAIAGALPDAARPALHRAVLDHLRALPDDPTRWPRVAYHAARAGEPALALAHYTRLAGRARGEHAWQAVVRWLTHALELAADAPPATRAHLLGARGDARRMLTHYEAGRADVVAARALAEAAGDRAAVVELLVAEAAICDFSFQVQDLTRLVDSALAVAATAPADDPLPDRVRARLDNWLGVVRARQGRLPEARAALEAAVAAAGREGDHETATGSMVMLGGVLRRLGEPAAGKVVLDRVIARCEELGDHFHAVTARFNRINVWRMLGRPADAEADAARVVELANRMGYDHFEVWSWYNLAELRWWAGELVAAFDAAAHAHRIGRERFRDHPPAAASLYYATLAATRGRAADARDVLARIPAGQTDATPVLRAMRELVRLVLDDDPGPGWDAALAPTRRDAGDEDVVLLWWLRGRAAVRRADGAAAAHAFAEAAAAAAALGRPLPPPAWPDE
jgi:tetratricopeptide (TPR) repeat protein